MARRIRLDRIDRRHHVSHDVVPRDIIAGSDRVRVPRAERRAEACRISNGESMHLRAEHIGHHLQDLAVRGRAAGRADVVELHAIHFE